MRPPTFRGTDGFVAVLLLSLVPLAISLLMSLFFLKAWLSPQEEALQICRSGLMQALAKTGSSMRELFLLNPPIQLLREQKRIAQLELELAIGAGNPLAAALARAQLEALFAEQQALRLRQQEKIAQMKFQLYLDEKKVEEQLHRAFATTALQYKKHFSYQASVTPLFAMPLAIRAVPSSDGGPPTYEPDRDFSAQQAVHVNWRSSLQLAEQKGRELWFPSSIKKQDGCAASLQIKGAAIYPILSAVRFSSSSS